MDVPSILQHFRDTVLGALYERPEARHLHYVGLAQVNVHVAGCVEKVIGPPAQEMSLRIAATPMAEGIAVRYDPRSRVRPAPDAIDDHRP